MNLNNSPQIKLVLSIILLLISVFVNAQKLPNVQTTSLHAPANVKIDGKATEWNNQFQAYNKAVELSYTIANDKNKMYLVIQSADEYIIKKMIWGRVTLSINKVAKKDSPDNVTINYPIIDRKDRPDINFKNKPKIIEGNPASVAEADQYMIASNKRFAEKSKNIKVTGIQGLDTLVSVYNTDGIKAASAFDNKMVYTYELAIDLKLFGLEANGHNKFYYHVMLNQLPLDDMPGITITRAPNGEITSLTVLKTNANAGTNVFGSTTDFWGEYTLAQ